ncbi:MAG TPA: type II secretion system F family protein [Alphaproteobacteria bacterium]|jgi:tight adherence protein B
MNPVILIGGALIILIILGMMALLISNNKKQQSSRALAVIKGSRNAGESGGKDERGDQDKRRAEIARKLKEQGEEDEEDGKKKKPTIAARMEMAGMQPNVKKYWIFSMVSAVVFALASKLAGMGMIVVIAMGVAGLLGFPHFFVSRKIKKRQKKFLEEFADALEAMVRLLKAGMPVTEAVAMAGREFTGPVGEEMTRIYEAQKVGISLADAALAAAKRMPLTEMQMFATGVTIQAQTGASLSEVLMNLAGTIRARYRLKRKVQALSSEAKASAGIIGCLPFLVGGGLFAISPDYMDPLIYTTVGKGLLIGGGVWMGIGILIMKAMINFKV